MAESFDRVDRHCASETPKVVTFFDIVSDDSVSPDGTSLIHTNAVDIHGSQRPLTSSKKFNGDLDVNIFY